MQSYVVQHVSPIGHLRLRVKFADGVEGEVQLKDSHLSGVFTRLRDPEFFAKVHCNQGFVEWPDDIDLAPDAMYEEIKAHGAWVLN